MCWPISVAGSPGRVHISAIWSSFRAISKPGYLHLRDQRHPDDLMHARADDFAAFALMIKGGVYDHLFG